MAHWDHRPEGNWKKFKFNQPYARGLKRLREEVLDKTDFDPAVLWQWGTMQALAVIEILKDCEKAFGEEGQKVVYGALRKVGYDLGSQILDGVELDEDISETEAVSFFVTIINRIAYASLENPKIDSDEQISFKILWCPHQDTYGAFDCRVQRYFVQGMIDAMKEIVHKHNWQVKFSATIPAGATTCDFQLWQADDAGMAEWESYTKMLEQKALKMARGEE